MKKIFNKVIVVLLIICALLMPINVFAEETSNQLKVTLKTAQENQEIKVTLKYNEEEQEILENTPVIGCKAAYVAEPITGKIIYKKNAHERMYPASTTKILTALLALEKCDLEEKATVSKRALDLVPEGYSNARLQVGESLSIKDLLYALLLPSANEAANVIAEHISGSVEAFAEDCNNRAKELGCEDLHFVNPNGIHDTDHYCTAYDLYLIAKECQKYEVFNEIVKTTSYTLPSTPQYPGTRTIKNTNELLLSGTYHYIYCTGIKTGFTSPAGQCLVASSSKDGIDLISVVLGGEAKNGINERFYDTKRLFEFVYDNYSIKEIAEEGENALTIEVEKATKETAFLDVVVDTNISTIVPNSFDNENIKTTIALNEDIVAPVKQNQVLGQISFYADGLIYTTNLIASHDVEKIPYAKYISIAVGAVVTILIVFVLILKIFRRSRQS